MSDKLKPSKKQSAEEIPSQMSGGQVFKIRGGIHAGRDVIAGDQYNYGGQSQQIANIQTQAEFVAELRKLQAEIAALKQQPDLSKAIVRNIEVLEAQVIEVVEEAQKPAPLGERVRATLAEAKDTMDLIQGSVQSAVDLGLTLGMLADAAIKVFGG